MNSLVSEPSKMEVVSDIRHKLVSNNIKILLIGLLVITLISLRAYMIIYNKPSDPIKSMPGIPNPDSVISDEYKQYQQSPISLTHKLTKQERLDSIKDAKKQIKLTKLQAKFNCSFIDAEDLADRQVWIGMTYEMLIYERGRPDNINISNYGGGDGYQACWMDCRPMCFYFKEDHIIYAYN